MKLERKTQLAYAAGIIDGEGSISLGIKKAKPNTMSNDSWTPRISVKMNNGLPLDLLYGLFGGSVRPVSPKYWDQDGKFYGFVWEISCEKAMKACKLMLPFLKVKLPQAQLLIRYQTRIEIGKKKYPRNGKPRIPSQEISKRRDLSLLMKQLNANQIIFPRAGATTKQIERFKTLLSERS